MNGTNTIDNWRGVTVAMGLSLLAACGTDDGKSADDALQVPTTYSFASRLETDASSVDYGGQVGRHALIARMTAAIGAMTAAIDGGKAYAAGEAQAELLFYYDFDGSVGGAVEHGLSTSPAPKQLTWSEASGKKVSEKIAGNDAKGQHRVWADVGMIGWEGATTPDALVRNWIAELDQLAADRTAGTIREGADGKKLANVAVTAAGHDLGQLLQKFLLGAVTFSQAADDYIDDDTEGKGLLSDHGKLVDGKGYTELEHAWDEGFGYFGAARDYAAYTDAELAGKGGDEARKKGHFDTDGDGKIDLFSEWNTGHAINCSKRDHGAAGKAEIDLSGPTFEAFLRGRARIAAAPLGPLDAATLAALKEDRDAAIGGWEACIAATVVHYVNETLGDIAKLGTAEWSHADAAKHWSELKGFALSLQFNRSSKLDKAAQKTLHAHIGMAPVLQGASADAIAKSKQGLLDARKMIMDAYAFPAALAGDEQGQGGW